MASTAVSSPPPAHASRSTSSPSSNVSYETFAPRSTAQVTRLSRIAALTAGPTARAAAVASSSDQLTTESSTKILLEAMCPPPLPAIHEGSSLTLTGSSDDNTVKKTLAGASDSLNHMTNVLKHTTSLRLALRASINIAEDISNRHAELLRHSGELSAAADRLQAEEELLARHAEEIGMPLRHYDAVDRIGIQVGVLFKGKTVVRGLAKIKVDNDDFPLVLDQIDDAVEFFGRESGGKEALAQAERRQRQQGEGASQQLLSGNIEYFRRSLALQDAALSLIREAVADRITQTAQDVSAALNTQKVPIPADTLEASLAFTRFHGISSRSNRLLTIVRKKIHEHRGEVYQELLQHCRTTYCQSRANLLQYSVRSHLDKLKNEHGLVGMTRLASLFLIRLCTVETSLYLDFFGDKKLSEVVGDDSERSGKKKTSTTHASSFAAQVMSEDGTYYDNDFQTYLTNLCSALHRTVRRGLVTVLDLDTLCQVVSVLREERSMASSSPTTMAAARAISTVIEDSQERLIFSANTNLTKEVVRFKATPADLNYPDKLRRKENEPSVGETAETTLAVTSDDDVVQQQLQVYEAWFPPMRSVLRILSKIFRVVEPRVFEDIALQSVQACTRCLKDGASYVKQKSGVMHADLFLVKHLLILREQLSPFDIELRSVERQLDFSDAGRAVSRFLANRNRRLFSMSTENALITLLREGVSVQESSVDSKRDLEDALRSACNDFIEHTATSVVGNIIRLVEQCKSVSPDALKTQAFFAADTVEGTATQTLERLEVQLGEVTSQMALYLDNAATQSILLKPVSRKVTRTLEEARKYIVLAADGDNGWDTTKRNNVLSLLDQIENGMKQNTKTAR